MKMLSVAVEEEYAKRIDELISLSGFYSSRSEFLKDSIRKNLVEILKFNKDIRNIHLESEKLALKAREKGFTGVKLSAREREKIAKKFIKQKKV